MTCLAVQTIGTIKGGSIIPGNSRLRLIGNVIDESARHDIVTVSSNEEIMAARAAKSIIVSIPIRCPQQRHPTPFIRTESHRRTSALNPSRLHTTRTRRWKWFGSNELDGSIVLQAFDQTVPASWRVYELNSSTRIRLELCSLSTHQLCGKSVVNSLP